jgi:SAM-dependent methyltransferase
MPQQVADLGALTDLCTPWCIHVAATLKIADHIAAGKCEIADLARAAGCDPYALHRVLTYLAGKGVFEEPSPGRFALNEAARNLLNPATLLGLDLKGIGGRMAHAWGTLLTYVRTGRSGYQDHFGLPFWEDLSAHPDVGESFDALMGPQGHGPPNPEFEISGGWDSVKSVVDVGGGTGAMLAALLRLRPGLRGTLVEFPRTVALSGETFQTAGVAERVTTVGQSFFDPLPAGADLYLLRKVMSNWPDREATILLRRCADAARPGGRIVVLGGVEADGLPRPLSIEMVLLGAKHRSVTEFRELARGAGLQVVAAGRQQSGYFVVECRPT